MSRITGRNVSIYVNDNTAASTALSARSNLVILSSTTTAPDISSFGAIGRERLPNGLQDWNINLDGYFDSDIDIILSGILSKETILRLGPSGSADDDIQYIGNCVLTSYGLEFAVGDAVKVTAEFVASSGSLSRYTWGDDSLALITYQSPCTIWLYSGSVASSGSITSGSFSTVGYSRLLGGIISSASAIAGSGLRISQSFDSGQTWDYNDDFAISACSGSGFSVEVHGNTMRVDLKVDSQADVVRALWFMRPVT